MNQPHGQKRKRAEDDYQRDISHGHRGDWAGRSRGFRMQTSWAHSDQARINELQEADRHREFLAKEGQFVLQQKRKAADIRIKEGRARPIDWLFINLRLIDPVEDLLNDDLPEDEIIFTNPETILDPLPSEQLKSLSIEINEILALEQKSRNREYWQTLLELCKHQQKTPSGKAVKSVSTDIAKLLGPKSYTELSKLQKQINAKLDSQEPIDTDYWQQLLEHLLVYKAKAKIQQLYNAMIENRLSKYRAQNIRKAAQAGQELQADQAILPLVPSTAASAALKISGDDKMLPVLSERDFLSRLEQDRRKVLKSRFVPAGGNGDLRRANADEVTVDANSALFDQEVAKGVDEDEEVFAGEAPVSSSLNIQPADKDRPRKPRYFNRVQMGYEWNKYNQTHYDHDNPPPKVVQGYKFHLFYPDLKDTTRAPTYKILREGGRKKYESIAPAGEEDMCVIHFMAGPPYKDVAFRIVDREWDFSAKNDRGFKSTFENGILTLHFSFRKVFYRK